MAILDGNLTSSKICSELSEQIEFLKENYNQTPCLAVVIIGDDAASKIYVRRKVKKAEELGIRSIKYELPADTTQQEVNELIAKLNSDPNIHGILVQSPPPPGINERLIIESLNPIKDVDCFHPYNIGKLMIGDLDGFLPCTPAGILVLLNRYFIDVEGKNAVVIGRSNIVGKPMSVLLSQKNPRANATVTLCHSGTKNMKAITQLADILVVALGRPNFIGAEMIKDGAVIVDVGINRVEDSSTTKGFRLVGDVDYDNVSKIASFITPVPGGVGPMTISLLMYNTILACCFQHKISLDYRIF